MRRQIDSSDKSGTAEANDPSSVSNVSFGLNPAARVVLNSVFLHGRLRRRNELGDRQRVEDLAANAFQLEHEIGSPAT